MHVTIRQLKVFESVARHLSYTQAANELHLSQPAVSMQVKQLEEKVGLPLFEQIGKKIYLTEAGREVFRYSRSIKQQLGELEDAIDSLKGISGKLSISVASTANYFVPTLLGTFCKRFPDVSVSLDVTNRKTLLQQLKDNETDLVIMGQPPANMDLTADAFMENNLVIIAPPDHRLSKQQRSEKNKIPLKKLENEIFLVREHGSGTRDAIERFFQARDIHITTGMEIGSSEAIKQSVQAGLGLGLLSRDTLDMELALNKLVILDVEEFPILRHWFIMHLQRKRLSTVAVAFKKFLLAEAKTTLGTSDYSLDEHLR